MTDEFLLLSNPNASRSLRQATEPRLPCPRPLSVGSRPTEPVAPHAGKRRFTTCPGPLPRRSGSTSPTGASNVPPTEGAASPPGATTLPCRASPSTAAVPEARYRKPLSSSTPGRAGNGNGQRPPPEPAATQSPAIGQICSSACSRPWVLSAGTTAPVTGRITAKRGNRKADRGADGRPTPGRRRAEHRAEASDGPTATPSDSLNALIWHGVPAGSDCRGCKGSRPSPRVNRSWRKRRRCNKIDRQTRFRGPAFPSSGSTGPRYGRVFARRCELGDRR